MIKKEPKSKDIGIEKTIAEIKKKFGDGAIMNLDEVRAVDVDAISSGSLALDMALGVMGYPRGRIIEIFGKESTGKTTIALHAIAEAQMGGGKVAFVDAEHALDPEYARRIGVDTSKLLLSQPASGEEALQIVEKFILSGDVDMVVIDSVSALTPKSEIDGDIGAFQVGAQARLMSQAMRKLTAILARSNTIVIFINQTRMKIGGMSWGNPETTSGGLALKFYASVRIELRKIAQLKCKEESIGSMIKARIVKNKVSSPFKIAEVAIYYNEGMSKFADIVNTGINYGIIRKSGSWLQFEDTKLGQGIDGAKTYLKENPDLMVEIRERVLEIEKNG